MSKQFFASYEIEGKTTAGVYSGCDNWARFFADTFSPDLSIIDCFALEIKGKTYQERKACAEDLAKRFQYADQGGLSWGEYAIMGEFFEKAAKRYGLIEEFKENGII